MHAMDLVIGAGSWVADLHDALHVATNLRCTQVALGVANHVQAGKGVLPSILGEVLVRRVGLHRFGCSSNML